jgi:hypothetical protein
MNRTPAGAGSQTTWTWSGWFKRGLLDSGGGQYFLFSAYNASTDAGYLTAYISGDVLSITGFTTVYRKTTRVFRNPDAWYHIVIVWDTTNGTAGNRVKLYINGVEETTFSISANPTASQLSGMNGANLHRISSDSAGAAAGYFDGYLTNVHFVNNQVLSPTDFGRTSADTGQWVPKTYTGTYGANGFKLDFTNSGALGTDSSGNGNNWTLNSITSANQYTDTPTNNHSVFNKLSTVTTSVLSVGNTKMTASTIAIGSLGMTGTMKPYWEVSSATAATLIGMYGTAATTTISVAAAKTYGMRFDAGAGTLDYINITDAGAWTSLAVGLTATPYFQYASTAASAIATINSGSKPFVGTVPSGYSAHNTANLPAPAIILPSLHFNAKTRTGTGAAFNVTGQSFQPDLVESKSRSAATDWAYYDSVRGVQKQLESNTTSAETTEATGLTAFNADGFSGGALAQLNTNAASYIDYMWKMGGAAVSNTNGSITSSVSANTLAGQSVVSATTTTAAGTIGHGLLSAPELIIGVNRAAPNGWWVYHSALGATKYMVLNTTAAAVTAASVWNNTAPTSTVFSQGSGGWNNAATAIFLCFHSVEGYSKVFSYTGNGSADGTSVYCGFKPRYVLVKPSTVVDSWSIYDALRPGYNVNGGRLSADTTATESTAAECDFTANGFKVRTTDSRLNTSGQTYIGIAFAEAPTKYATAR